MPNQGDFNRVEPGMSSSTGTGFGSEPGIPQGTNAGLLSSSGMPVTSDTGMSSSGGLMGRVTSIVDGGKARLAGGLHDLGDRIEHTGRDLESGNFLVRPVGRALDSTGNALESGARYLRTTDVDVIGDDVVDGIRTHPLVSAGIAVGCGVLLGKMFGSSDESEAEASRTMHDEPHDRHRPEPEEEEREHSESPSMMDRLMGKVSDVVAGGIAAYAARQVRDRIAGR